LKRAKEKHLISLPFPGIGIGIAGFPLARCAQVMLEEIRTYLSRPTRLQRVLLVLFDDFAVQIFQQTLSALPA